MTFRARRPSSVSRAGAIHPHGQCIGKVMHLVIARTWRTYFCGRSSVFRWPRAWRPRWPVGCNRTRTAVQGTPEGDPEEGGSDGGVYAGASPKILGGAPRVFGVIDSDQVRVQAPGASDRPAPAACRAAWPRRKRCLRALGEATQAPRDLCSDSETCQRAGQGEGRDSECGHAVPADSVH